MIKTLKRAADLSLKATKSREFEADLSIYVEGERWSCYAVNISNRDLLSYCDKGSATFLVDTFGDRVSIELFDWEKDC